MNPIRSSFSLNRQEREAIREVAEKYHVTQGYVVGMAAKLFTEYAEKELTAAQAAVTQGLAELTSLAVSVECKKALLEALSAEQQRINEYRLVGEGK